MFRSVTKNVHDALGGRLGDAPWALPVTATPAAPPPSGLLPRWRTNVEVTHHARPEAPTPSKESLADRVGWGPRRLRRREGEARASPRWE